MPVETAQSRQHALAHGLRGRGRLERPSSDPIVGLDVGQRGLPDQLRRDLRNVILVRVASGGDPGADHVLVEAVRELAGGEALRVGVGAPVAAGVRGVDFVGEADGSLGVDAELILRVGEDQAALGG